MSLLPNYKSKFDKKLDEFFGVKLDGLDISVINTLADTCPAGLLPILAANFDVDIDGLSKIAARELIKNAFEIHYYSGTFYSLQKALSAFYDTAKISEWHSYGGKPYHFKLSLEASNKGISKESLAKTDELVNEYKNVRSVFDGTSIAISSRANVSVASFASSGESIEVYPFMLQNLDANVSFCAASAVKTNEIISVNLNLKGII
ncbi:phage tail protein I [Campylobacter hyointestinalis]|uniref:phage tail protein I n=1 Tax=Campylobacter hyointestinalis TaxID=198 RepID=UPI001BD2AD99|nr:phage tail protein I [Campylobacter hyointestinalis]MBT0611953.1 phage tail protein I [Campylobacter hyointestinalis subsp. hyointestinalis]MDY2999460.1 phage tail protein I [Campylobacter hyointestinalis]